MADLPLLRRFPALASLPRASLGTFPTPVARLTLPGGRAIWIKRDDRSGAPIGGNKVRALEFLLGGIRPGDEVLTVGPRGSTHALSTATYAAQLGATTTVVRWPQEMNPAATRVDARLRQSARIVDASNVVTAHAIAWWRRRRAARWIPAGGTTPLGILGYVNAGLELAEQIERGECPAPREIVLPLGTGGTAAGVWLGLHLAGVRCRMRVVRVAPRIVASRWKVIRLAQRTRELMEAITRARLSFPSDEDLRVESGYYAGGYGRPIAPSADEGALTSAGITLDDTYSRKAFSAAARDSSDSTLFWLTFDGRLLQD